MQLNFLSGVGGVHYPVCYKQMTYQALTIFSRPAVTSFVAFLVSSTS